MLSLAERDVKRLFSCMSSIYADSATTKAVLVNSVRSTTYSRVPKDFDFISTAEKAYKDVLAHEGVDKKHVYHIYATGYCRNV